ncbi:hypothetical protein IV102_11865 [bacterium]|nr:hypothetical protein [bacterium]
MKRIFSLLVGALALTGAVWAQPCNQQGYTQGYQVQVPYGHYYCNQHAQYCNHPQYNYSTQSGFGLTTNSANSGWYSDNSSYNHNNAAWSNNNSWGNRSWGNGNCDNGNRNNWNNRWNGNRYQNQGRYQRQNRNCRN